MSITLTVSETTLILPSDLMWSDEFEWHEIVEASERSLSGALVIDQARRLRGRPITLQPSDENSAWMAREALAQLALWEKTANLTMQLNLRGLVMNVRFRRWDGTPIEAHSRLFVANPQPGGFGDWYIATLRFYEV